jgi:hypothetical protein
MFQKAGAVAGEDSSISNFLLLLREAYESVIEAGQNGVP